jgi:hypothetical protein
MNGYELLSKLEKELKDCLYISNEHLPDGFKDTRTDGVSLATLERKCDELERQSRKVSHDAERARRIALYREQIATTGRISFEPPN